jgi:predicted nucleotidyltransferase
MTMRTPETTELSDSLPVSTLRSVLRDHPVRLAVLFGSRAAGNTHPGSDIDLAVEFDSHRPGDSGYNDVFFGLSADLSDVLETDDIDLVDVHTLSPALARSVFEDGVLLVGTPERAATIERERTAERDTDTRSPRERFDDALERIDGHLGAASR